MSTQENALDKRFNLTVFVKKEQKIEIKHENPHKNREKSRKKYKIFKKARCFCEMRDL